MGTFRQLNEVELNAVNGGDTARAVGATLQTIGGIFAAGTMAGPIGVAVGVAVAIVHIALMAAYHMNKGRKGNVLIQAANVCYFMMHILKFVLPKSIITEIAKYFGRVIPHRYFHYHRTGSIRLV
ncbi:hypothetical protein [Paenibacillus popilliae]|uniref:Predicted oxidoreductase n=1 Tax=Paenibacillus popilliae ATCC 14706 TaxID=1212764 RepID=M9M102_PAEPP|nr:hypothetical protein [Paenibacillus popilliae]GAC42554.1 predicted oxidoreductase [Paenibacillus popilliae ATCC 14706]